MRLSIHAISDGKTSIKPTAENAADIEALLPEGWRHIALCDKASGAVRACWQYAPGHEPAKWEIERVLGALGTTWNDTTIGVADGNYLLSQLSGG